MSPQSAVVLGLVVSTLVLPALEAQTDSGEPIFNGTDLSGWVVEGTADQVRDGQTRPVWSVRDGMIDCQGHGFGFLRYDRVFHDFALHVEYRMPTGCNSGIGIRGVKFTGPFATRPSAAGFELQLLNDADKPPTAHSSGSLYRYVAPKSAAVKPAPAWNSVDIECVGPRLRVFINGTCVQDIDQTTVAAIAAKPLSGYVSLQNHAGNVQFRNVRVKDLLPSVKPGINDPFRDPNVAEFVERFEREGREVYDQRAAIVAACALPAGAVVADVGAGTGLFTRLFSPVVGARGKVIAVEIAPKFIDHIRKSCENLGLTNVTTRFCTPTSVDLPAQSIDVAFICDTYHHFEYPDRTLKSIRTALRPGGQIVLVEFHRKPGVSSDWVLEHVRADQGIVAREIEATGFKAVENLEFLTESYFMRFVKSD